jgi:hypothetical protein
MFAQIDNLQWKTTDLDVALVGILSEIRHTTPHHLKKARDTHSIYMPIGVRVECL